MTTYRATSIESLVMKRGSDFYLKVPEDWIGQDVFVIIEGMLEHFNVTSDSEVIGWHLKPYEGYMLEVALQENE